jgi:hypothetical protein
MARGAPVIIAVGVNSVGRRESPSEKKVSVISRL